jgi:hypothetical protein
MSPNLVFGRVVASECRRSLSAGGPESLDLTYSRSREFLNRSGGSGAVDLLVFSRIPGRRDVAQAGWPPFLERSNSRAFEPIQPFWRIGSAGFLGIRDLGATESLSLGQPPSLGVSRAELRRDGSGPGVMFGAAVGGLSPSVHDSRRIGRLT